MTARRRSHAAQTGLVRGCCLGLIILGALIVATVVFASRALAAPDLGPPPGGTVHGSSELVIAAALGGDAATQMVNREHAVVVLSERDLTVIVNARNPSPDRFRNPEARIRNGDVVVSADTSIGPFGVTAVVNYQLQFSSAAGATQVNAHAVDYAVGQLGIPGFIGDRFNPRGSASLNLTTLFAANPVLEGLSQSMDCIAVQPDGVHIGFHRPGVGASASTCG